MTNEQIDALVADSDGEWHEDEFRIDGVSLSALLRATALVALSHSAAPVAQVGYDGVRIWMLGGTPVQLQAGQYLYATPPPSAAPVEPVCGICFGDPERCDIHDCGDAHRTPSAPKGEGA